MREVVEVWLRLQIVRKNVSGTKMSKKFVNQAAKVWIKPLSLSIRAAEKNLNRVDPSSRYYKFGCKKTHVVFEQLDLNFK